jgi:hypothetical protein
MGLASRMETHPEADRFNNTSGDFANDVPDADTSMPAGWEDDPNWGSDAFVWAEMKDPAEPSKASSKKQKTQAHDSEPQADGWIAVHDKATREYLTQSTMHTLVDKALKTKVQLALRTFALREAEWAKNMVILTPQFTELPLRPWYLREGEPLPHGDPPYP